MSCLRIIISYRILSHDSLLRQVSLGVWRRGALSPSAERDSSRKASLLLDGQRREHEHIVRNACITRSERQAGQIGTVEPDAHIIGAGR